MDVPIASVGIQSLLIAYSSNGGTLPGVGPLQHNRQHLLISF